MPSVKREPLPTIIRMRVVNPHAPHAGEEGWIIDTTQSGNLIFITLQFDTQGRPEKYERSELELVAM